MAGQKRLKSLTPAKAAQVKKRGRFAWTGIKQRATVSLPQFASLYDRLHRLKNTFSPHRKRNMSHIRRKLWACATQYFFKRGIGETRSYSNLPDATVYGGPKPQNPAKRITLRHLASKYAKREPITMVTAYDYPSAVHVDHAGIDICLVGDSVGMVVHGHDTTLPVTMDDMLLHCRAVARGASRPLLVGDLPFGSYERSSSQAVESATRILKEGGMDAVKLGGYGSRVTAAKAIVEAGVAVMGHVGLTPQAISALGGFRPQGQTSSGAMTVLENALALQESGCFGIVLECLPSPVAAAITAALSIPTIGIGAGPRCSGQVLVYHDLLGMMQHPHYAKVTPKFCKRYAQVGSVINEALVSYKDEVANGSFPSPAYSPYKIDQKEVESFLKELDSKGLSEAAEAASTAVKQMAEQHYSLGASKK